MTHVFINPDLTIFYERDPDRRVGRPAGPDARLAPGAVALAESVLWDERGADRARRADAARRLALTG